MSDCFVKKIKFYLIIVGMLFKWQFIKAKASYSGFVS